MYKLGDIVTLPDGRRGRIITTPIGSRKFVTVMVIDPLNPLMGQAYQIDADKIRKEGTE